MVSIHETKPLAILTWDWKEQINCDSLTWVINEVIARNKNAQSLNILSVETNADEFAIVIGDKNLTIDEAKRAYSNRYEIQDGIDCDNLDWDSAKDCLKEIRQQYTDIGVAGIPALTAVINPLLIRYENGERSKALFDEIMGLS